MMNKKIFAVAMMSVFLASYGASAKANENSCYSATNRTIASVVPVNVYNADLTNLPDGTLIRVLGDPRVYVIKNGQLVLIPTLQEFNRCGYNWKHIKIVSKNRFEQIKKRIDNKKHCNDRNGQKNCSKNDHKEDNDHNRR